MFNSEIFYKVSYDMITCNLNTNSKNPLYMQLYSFIKHEIESGNMGCGEKLPSKRALAVHLKISVITVETAYAQLLAEGYITSKPGSGFYVESFEETDKVSPPSEVTETATDTMPIQYDFRTNRIDTSDFPFSTWAKLSREVLSERSADLLNACHHQGIPILREEIASYLREYRGMTVDSEQIVVGAGSEYLT